MQSTLPFVLRECKINSTIISERGQEYEVNIKLFLPATTTVIHEVASGTTTLEAIMNAFGKALGKQFPTTKDLRPTSFAVNPHLQGAKSVTNADALMSFDGKNSGSFTLKQRSSDLLLSLVAVVSNAFLYEIQKAEEKAVKESETKTTQVALT